VSDQPFQEMTIKAEDAPTYETITIGDPQLAKLHHFHHPYKPFTFLSQTYCQALHLGRYTLATHQKLNKEQKNP
jgi:hypothetical protein